MKKSTSSDDRDPKSPILSACGGGDIEDIWHQPRGWTAKAKPIKGEYVLVNMQNPSFAGETVKVIGALENGRIPVITDEKIQVRIRPKNLARPDSEAALGPIKTAEEAKRYLDQVDSEMGRISPEDVNKIKTSPSCGCGSCARACWIQPGMYGPSQVLDMKARGVFDPDTVVLDFYNSGERPNVGILRPRTVEESGSSLAPFTPTPGTPCVHLGPKGCTLPSDLMPINCRALHCDKTYHVHLDKHTSAYALWETPEGRQAVAWFQKQIQAKNPSAPTTEEHYLKLTIMSAMNPKLGFAHELGCARTPVMIEKATERMKVMMLSPDPEIIEIIKKQLMQRLKYADDMEKSLLTLLFKSLTALEVCMARK